MGVKERRGQAIKLRVVLALALEASNGRMMRPVIKFGVFTKAISEPQ